MEDITNAIVAQNKYNFVILPNRFELQKESIQSGENFHKYTGELRLLGSNLLERTRGNLRIPRHLSTTILLTFYRSGYNDFVAFIQMG